MKKNGYVDWCYASLEEVRANIEKVNCPQDHLVFVKGKVEDTLPNNNSDQIALLRLDTDWYASTYHELTHLFPLLVERGVLLLDDYGYWEGSKKATDQFLAEKKILMLLNRIDPSGVIGIKTTH